MKKLALLILAGGVWMAGYWCGRQPNSPDIFGWTAQQATSLSRSQAAHSAGEAFRGVQRQISALLVPAQQPAPAPNQAQAVAEAAQPG